MSRPHPTQRLIAWPPDAFMPREVQHFLASLQDLYLASLPSSSGSVGELGGAKPTSRSPSGANSPQQARCRRRLTKVLRLLASLADENEITIRGGTPEPQPHSRCRACGRGQRIAARFCDGCGADLRKAG